ncbi:STAS domain-containing protein [Fulvimonas soli]|jgi:phospholipid transport system transporter-binding protein|uniref:Phospholipid transport system transporter-binding protein n=1 Tax=Fulvimonas soli TaxID=155197 RepID=A0A316I8E2_9GAMM|nr:STAS domain-containing protein [Fulvimonas soli]PWK83534.1 phospholipid transport system transporter-binding protein [Fulvimonas soli]TNY24968.1 sulfate transporter [Fulvimonas soli]
MSQGAFRLSRAAPGTLGLEGELSFATAAAALREIGAAVRAERPRRLDLAGLARSDSAGLACLLAVQADAARRGGRLEVVNMPAGMRALARLCEVEALAG